MLLETRMHMIYSCSSSLLLLICIAIKSRCFLWEIKYKMYAYTYIILPFLARGCISVNMELSYHLLCWRPFNPQSPTNFMVTHFYVETNLPTYGISEAKAFHFSKIWEDIIVANFWKFPSWNKTCKSCFFKIWMWGWMRMSN